MKRNFQGIMQQTLLRKIPINLIKLALNNYIKDKDL